MVTGPHATTFAVTLVLLSMTVVAGAAESSGDAVSNGTAAQTTGKVDPPKSSRLRFRSGGPACMCVSGMSEEEIAAAAQRRRSQSADSPENIVPDP